jgi:hypothetical protein
VTEIEKPIGFSGVRTLQYLPELEEFKALLASEGVRSYLEVGAHHGDTMHDIGLALPHGSRLVGVDLPGATAGGYTNSGRALKRAAGDLTAHGRPSHAVLGNSHDKAVIAQAAALGPYDAVFIDGDHTLEGAEADWQAYGPLGRIVAFHDIMRLQSRKACAVHKIWARLKSEYRHVEISCHPTKRGIGVLWRC